MRRVRFHPEAEAELRAAAAHYDSLRRGPGTRFLVAVQDAVTRVTADPSQYQVVHDDARRCITRTFPFGVVYRSVDDVIVVL